MEIKNSKVFEAVIGGETHYISSDELTLFEKRFFSRKLKEAVDLAIKSHVKRYIYDDDSELLSDALWQIEERLDDKLFYELRNRGFDSEQHYELVQEVIYKFVRFNSNCFVEI